MKWNKAHFETKTTTKSAIAEIPTGTKFCGKVTNAIRATPMLVVPVIPYTSPLATTSIADERAPNRKYLMVASFDIGSRFENAQGHKLELTLIP